MIHLKGDTAAALTLANPVLGDRQICFETDTLYAKLGDGITTWNALPYLIGFGATVWGSITGTLSNQIDLQIELDKKASKAFALAMASAL